jgi:DNA-binding transcriptional LysR family regulator
VKWLNETRISFWDSFLDRRLRIEQELPSREAVKRMVAAGAGIVYVSRLSVQQELTSGQLVEIHCAKLQKKYPFRS